MLRRIDHVGIVVKNLDEATTFLSDVFHLEMVKSVDDPDRRLKAAFFRCGDINLEVLEPDDPAERARRLGPGSEARVEHIAIQVDDLGNTLESLMANGVQVNPRIPISVSGGLTTWTEAESSGGVIYQLIEKR